MGSYNEFLDFLEANNCRKQFEKAFYSYNKCHKLSQDLWNLMGGDECFVGRAFDWSKTSEGYDFWLGIDIKWYNQNS